MKQTLILLLQMNIHIRT